MTHAGWLYKIIIDKHVTGPPLNGQIQIAGVWGTPSDRLYFSVDYPTASFIWWKSPVFCLEQAKRTPFGDGLACGAAEEREACVKIALDEKVSGETGTAEDAAYNQACEDIAERIRSVK